MALPRAPLSPIAAGEQALSRELGGYLVRVLRLRAGDRFVVFDPDAGIEADAVLVRDVPALARVEAPRVVTPVAGRAVTLLQNCEHIEPECSCEQLRPRAIRIRAFRC